MISTSRHRAVWYLVVWKIDFKLTHKVSYSIEKETPNLIGCMMVTQVETWTQKYELE